MGLELFNLKEVSEYTAEIYLEMESEIEAFSNEKIMTCDLEEWADYYSEEYGIQPVVVYKDNVSKRFNEQKFRVYNQWSRMNPYEPEYFNVDGYNIDFLIPFDGDSMLWRLRPSTFIMQEFEVEDIKEPTKDCCGTIIFRLEYTASELKNKGENVSVFIEKQFNREFSNYEQMISYVNSEINSYNKNLRRNAMELLKKKKE